MKDRVVIISGASRGLGKALALGFGAQGSSLGICARDRTRLDSVATSLKKIGAQAVSSAFDVSVEPAAQRFVDLVIHSFGRIDVLVNNASLLGPRLPIASYPVDAWDRVIAVNTNGAFYLTKHALKIMLAQKEGSIINVSSSVGRRARKGWGAYAVSKFALEGLTDVLADELRGTGIRVNSVNPGPLATDMRREAYPDEDQTGLKRPDEILDVFFYLASDESAHVSGEKLDAQSFRIPNQKVTS